jgi:hypothetical protein
LPHDHVVRIDTARLDGKTSCAKRLEQIVIVPIDQGDVERNLREGARRR